MYICCPCRMITLENIKKQLKHGEVIFVGDASPKMIFFQGPHIFPYYPSKCLHNEFILPVTLPVNQLRYERHKHDFKLLNEHTLNSFCLYYRLGLYDVIM